MTRDGLLGWLWLPWNLAKTIGAIAWWIGAALVCGSDADD
jgi:hypothetical protein